MRLRIVLAIVVGIGVVAALPMPSGAVSTVQHKLVSANPADYTPFIKDDPATPGIDRVNSVAVVGNRVIVGGKFSTGEELPGWRSVAQAPQHHGLQRHDWRHRQRLRPGRRRRGHVGQARTRRHRVFVGGKFKKVNGDAVSGLAKLNVTTGRRFRSFNATTNGWVLSMVVRGSRVYLGGTFTRVRSVARRNLAAVDTTTGAVDPNLNIPISQPIANSTFVQDLDVSAGGSRLVILGNFQNVGGRARSAGRGHRPQSDASGDHGALGDGRLPAWCLRGHDADVRAGRRHLAGRPVLRGRHQWRVEGCRPAVRHRGPLGARPNRPDPTDVGRVHRRRHTDVGGGDRHGGLRRWSPALDEQLEHARRRQRRTGIDESQRPRPRSTRSTAWPTRGTPAEIVASACSTWWPRRPASTSATTPTSSAASTARESRSSRCPAALTPTPDRRAEASDEAVQRTVRRHAAQPDLQRVDLRRRPQSAGTGWSHVRGTFTVNHNLYTGRDDGRLLKRSFDGTTFRPAGRPRAAGRASPTRPACSSRTDVCTSPAPVTRQLYYRKFEPQNGLVGSQLFVVSGNGDGLNWSTTRGMTMVGGKIYVADTFGNLRSDRPVRRPPGASSPPRSSAVRSSTDGTGHRSACSSSWRSSHCAIRIADRSHVAHMCPAGWT